MRRFWAILLCMGATIAFLAGSAACTTVGYYVEAGIESSPGWVSAITANGFTAVRITNISTFDLSTVNILAVERLTTSGSLHDRLSSIGTWVNGGGKFIVHDWTINPTVNNPFLIGATGVNTVAFSCKDINVPSVSPISSGPFGSLNNASLDGGNLSAHGYVVSSTLPSHAQVFLTEGAHPSGAVSLGYRHGNGWVYYSTIPIGYYLGNYSTNAPLVAAMNDVYTPNVLAYMNAVPEPSSLLALLTGIGGLSGLVWRRRTSPSGGRTACIRQA